jgi:hypothetical protein
MLGFTTIRGLVSQTASRSTSSRRRGRTGLMLETLEGRTLMATNFLAMGPAITPPPAASAPAPTQLLLPAVNQTASHDLLLPAV